MPTPATDTFRQIAGQEPGPFTQFLRPQIPLDFGQHSPQTAATGYENAMTGTGKTVLDFLASVRDQRKALAEQEDRNVQFGLDNFQRHVANMLANPDLTEEGRQAIRDQADQVMNQHMHYEMKDVPKDGIHGFIKNLLTQATGGGIKVREPINWNEATGQITNVRKPEHSQDYNFADIVQRGQAAVEAMTRDMAAKGRAPAKEDFEAAWQPYYFESLTKAPNHAPSLGAAAGMGGLGGSTTGYFYKTLEAGGRGGSAAARTGAPPAFSFDTGIGSTPPGGNYNVLRPGRQQPPMTGASMPLPPALSGALTGPTTPPQFTAQAEEPAPGAEEQPAGSATLRPGMILGQSVPTRAGGSVRIMKVNPYAEDNF